MSHDTSKWLAIPRPNPWSELRLICFPYAGGTTATYVPWRDSLPQQVELVAVQPPGRGNRLSEPSYRCPDALVADLYPLLKAYLDQPYVVFGHSMGARLGYALLRKIQHEGDALPVRFIVSASPAPDTVRDEDINQGSDKEFVDYFKKLGGTPVEVLESAELMAFYLPRLRADLTLAGTYFPPPVTQFETELSLLAGRLDQQVSMDELLAWRHFFRFGGIVEEFAGGHMFIETARDSVLSSLNQMLHESLAMLACDGFDNTRTL
ncbi:MAG: thioesterase [Halioglobus sp.]|nr:thioesterase [Halioglobus sp.]